MKKNELFKLKNNQSTKQVSITMKKTSYSKSRERVHSTDSYWFSSISPFAMFAKSINDFTISFGAFSLFMIPFTREMHWPPAVFIV